MSAPGSAPSDAVELAFEHVRLVSFRNLSSLELTPAPRLNVIAGDNGQGKTSVIEGLYLAATSKSFRAERLAELIKDGSEQATVVARVAEGGLSREQRAAVSARGRSFTIDGKRPKDRASYATRTPVVVFHPESLSLASGAAAGRRLLLDRVALFLSPASADHRARYLRALRERQRALEQRGALAPELAAFEQLAAEHGAAFAAGRRQAAEAVSAALLPAFTRMATPGLSLQARYRAGGVEDAQAFRAELEQRRRDDLRRGRPTFGPQRDELELFVDGRSARRHASQGQQRILALSLKLAELSCLRDARRAHPVLLLDDVSSELDPGRTGAVYRLVAESQSQVFVTTTRPELFVTPDVAPDERADFRLVSGALAPA